MHYREYHGCHVIVSDNGQTATKNKPRENYAGGVVYSDRPLGGICEFEVELTSYGTGWSGNLKLGIALFEAGNSLTDKNSKAPRYSPEANDHCVWCDDKIFDKIQYKKERKFGKEKRLDDLREGDKLGLQITKDGVLAFYINEEYQGVALTDVYKPGYDVYAIVDLYGNAISVNVSKAG